MIYNYTLNLLIKIGQKEHIDLLQSDGLIHSKTVKYFREKEINEQEIRHDSAEGATDSIRISKMKLVVDNIELPLSFEKARLNFFNPDLDLTHLFCLYAVTPDLNIGHPFIDERVTKFGDTALLITNPGEFIRRIAKEVKNKFDYVYKPIHYYPDTNDYSKLTVFNKPLSFKYQREFRFHFEHKDQHDLEFEIGSIEDISTKIKSEKLPGLVLKTE